MSTKSYQRIVLASLLALLLAAGAGFFLTRTSGGGRTALNPQSKAVPGVDLRPLHTAQELAPLASGSEEQGLARDALRIADHEIDLNFAQALFDAASEPVPSTPEIRAILARIADAEKGVAESDAEIAQINKLLASAREEDKKLLNQQLQVAKARLELNEDEMTDADEDLSRAGGDPQSRIQRMVAEHDSADHEGGGSMDMSETGTQAISSILSSNSFLGHARLWYSLRAYRQRLSAAEEESAIIGEGLARLHDDLQPKLTQPLRESVPAAATAGAGAVGAAAAGAGTAVADAALPGTAPGAGAKANTADTALLKSLQALAAAQKRVSGLDHRVQDQRDLAGIYLRWGAMVAGRQRVLTHSLLGSIMWMLLVGLGVFALNRATDHFFDRVAPDRKRLLTLRSVVNVATRAAGVIVVLLIIFGPPTQAATVLALAGAGLTVALKDFIVGFFGWFVLMGKDGIRHGDWVEINGVSGEVIEIGLFHTMLLETGSGNDSGHPTGRRVTFINSYAIEGHYFNFSTTGQWLWDELQIVLPADQDPDPVVNEIQKIVAKETEANSREAEQEWSHLSTSRGMHTFSASPSITLRPANLTVEVLVRYVTRANERQKQRSKLYYEIVELLRRRNIPQGPQPAETPAPVAQAT